jgi:hypothetical protein
VREPNGTAIGKCRVCAVYYTTSEASVPMCVDSDAEGRYAILGLPAGRYLVTAARARFVAGSAQRGQPIDLLEGTVRTGVDIVLQPGGALLTGIVADAAGGPVPHATVRAEHNLPPAAVVDVEADDLGRFTLWFPPGPLLLSAVAIGYAPARWMGVAPSAEVRLVLTPGATIRGRVV